MEFLGELSNLQIFKDPVHWCMYEIRGGGKTVWVNKYQFCVFFFLLILVVNSLIYDNMIFFLLKPRTSVLEPI
jgi:hypothetical protein